MRSTLVALFTAACASLYFVVRLQPSSAGAFVFLAVWLTVPHAAMAVLLLALQRRGKPVLPWCIAALLTTLGGLYVLADAIYWHPDAQSAIGVVLMPVLQAIAFLFVSLPATWISKRMSS